MSLDSDEGGDSIEVSGLADEYMEAAPARALHIDNMRDMAEIGQRSRSLLAYVGVPMALITALCYGMFVGYIDLD